MPLRLATGTRNAKVNAAVARLDAGVGPGEIRVYTGAQPATPQTAASGTLLATIVLADPAYGAAAAGTANLVDPAAVTAVADGTAGWCRFVDSAAVAVFDGDVTATGGGGVLELATTTVSTGLSIDVTGGTYTQPE